MWILVGGIPYYLGYFDQDKSLPQNIDKLFFDSHAKLQDEYDRLFSSVFTNADEMKSIVDFLGKRHSGFSRKEILQYLHIDDSGSFSDKLKALIASDFVIEYVPFGERKRSAIYKLVDPFCIFYQKYVKNQHIMDSEFWSRNSCTQSVVSWRGIAFEEVCFKHIAQIKKALGISGVTTSQSAWSFSGDPDDDGTQIDLLIHRNDNVINMCELKFYSDDFTVDKAYDRKLAHRMTLLLEKVAKKYAIHSTLVTTFGLKHNEYSGDFTSVVTLDDLFQE